MINKHKENIDRARNLLLHREEMRKQKVFLNSSPLYLQLEVTNRCNLNCSKCARNYWDAECNIFGDMSKEVFRKLTSFIPRAFEVIIGGYGEPFMGKHFWYLLEELKKNHSVVRIITNGTFLNEDACRRLIDLGIDRLVVSLDSLDNSTAEVFREALPVTIMNNLKLLRELKQGRGQSAPEVSINFVAMRDNIRDLVPLIGRASFLGITGIEVSQLKIYSPLMKEKSLFTLESGYEKRFILAQREARLKGIWITLPTVRARDKTCLQPFENLFIRWNGEVMGCCSAIFKNQGYNFSVGSIDASTIEEIWNCRSMIDYREAFWGGKPYPENCQNCAFRQDTLESHLRYLDL